MLFPLKKATSSAVVKHLENDVFFVYGVPERLLCDNGRQYISSAFKKMVASYDCKIQFNAQYSPTSNPTERINLVIKTMISSYITKDQRTWDEVLPKVGFALRTSVHEVTGYRPAYLNFGREIFVSGKQHRITNCEGSLGFGSRNILADHMGEVQGLIDKVRERLDRAYRSSAERFNL